MCRFASSQAPQATTFTLFGLTDQTFDEEALKQLGDAMSRVVESQISRIPSGYVYLGQLISHDISRLPRPFAPPTTAQESPYKPLLDLDGIYRNGFNEDWVDKKTGRMRFRRGTAMKAVDLPRDAEGHARIGDDRNDENLVLAQLHLQFLKLHNFFVERIEVEASRNPQQVFEAAQKQVILHYQQVVLYDFLDTVLDPRVWQHVIWEHGILDNKRIFPDPQPGQPALLPVEFAAAAFRFGHSMVRECYQLTDRQAATLDDLFDMTHFGALQRPTPGELAKRLPQTHVIDWKHFFRGLDDSRDPREMMLPNLGLAIDLAVPVEVPNASAGVLSSNDPRDKKLAVKNLLTGKAAQLPSGQAVFRHLWEHHLTLTKALGIRELKPEELNPKLRMKVKDQPNQVEEKHIFDPSSDMQTKTPLWYYILAEARAHHGGQRLGPLGSLIVAESIRAMMLQTKPCVLKQDFTSTYIVGTKDIHGQLYLKMTDLLRAVR